MIRFYKQLLSTLYIPPIFIIVIDDIDVDCTNGVIIISVLIGICFTLYVSVASYMALHHYWFLPVIKRGYYIYMLKMYDAMCV